MKSARDAGDLIDTAIRRLTAASSFTMGYSHADALATLERES